MLTDYIKQDIFYLESDLSKQIKEAGYETIDEVKKHFKGVYNDWDEFVYEEICNIQKILNELAQDNRLEPEQRDAIRKADASMDKYEFEEDLNEDYQAIELENGKVLIFSIPYRTY